MLNENKFDIVWLIDVNDHKAIILNGFKKYTDGRSVLLVKDEIMDSFFVSSNCIYSPIMKLAFVYLTPASKDNVLINNINILLRNNYSIFGDFNCKSNRIFAQNSVFHFSGEDSLQIGAIAKKYIKTVSVAAPSDHRFVIFNFRNFANLCNALKIGEIGYSYSKDCIWNILKGNTPNYKPKVIKKQYYMGLNDREASINAMIDDYLNTNVRKIFGRYNFLWKFDRREPFLGKTVPDNVRRTYAIHLREKLDKNYVEIPRVHYDRRWVKNLTVQKTDSHAINHEFISLTNITKAVNEFLLDPDNKNYDIINNVIKVANDMLQDLNAEVFFLQKNKVIKDFNDVRVIIIIPTIIKIFESLIFNKVMSYLSKIISKKQYQFGGVIGGSTYKAMLKIKSLNKKGNARGVVLLDMSKGYDTVNLEILEKKFDDINNEEVRALLVAWVKMIKNMNVVVNDDKILRTRGIPMGLSLSPVVFAFYVDKALAEIPKSHLSMYLDDLAIVFEQGKSTFLCKALVNRIIEDLAKFDLIINEKKTVFLSLDKEIIEEFKDRFKKVDSEKYLGRLISLNGDGKIVPDDRFYNLNSFRSSACCYWATFFTKRLIFNAALDAKLRYRLYMWATDSIVIRSSIWVNNWKFFRKCMGSYSYLQLMFATTNIFRYFLDISDIIDWRTKWNNNDKFYVTYDIKNKLYTKIDKINNAIDKLVPNFEGANSNLDDFDFAKKFVDNLWNSFKKISLANYIKEKKLLNLEVYENIKEFCFSKMFNYFGILQQIVFLHFRRNNQKGRAKEIFLLTVLNALSMALHKSVIYSIYNLDPEAEMVDFNFKLFSDSIIFPFDEEAIYKFTIPEFEEFMIKEFKKLWPLIDIILDVFNDSKRKGECNIEEITKKLNMFEFVAYVDGSAGGDKIGYGGVICHKANDIIAQIKGRVGGKYAEAIRNVAGELSGTLFIIQKAIDLGIKNICLVFDYWGIQKYFTGEWLPRDPYTKEYVLRLKNLCKDIEISFFKISSHTGLPGNEKADTLAKEAINFDNKESNFKPSGPVFSQEKIIYLKNAFKVLFKLLTVIEMIYLNNNLNDLSVSDLVMNLMVKFYNLDDFTEKNFRLATIDDNLDPIDDNFMDIINDII